MSDSYFRQAEAAREMAAAQRKEVDEILKRLRFAGFSVSWIDRDYVMIDVPDNSWRGSLRKKLKRAWCRLMHNMLWKTEQVEGFQWRKRCLECGETYLLEPRPPNWQ